MGCNTIYPDCDMNRWESQCSSYIVDADNYYTKAEVDAKIESGVTPDLSDYYTKEETDSAITSAITAVEAEIPTVPTSNTAFTNDAGYITGVDLSNYATLGDLQTVSGDVQNGLTAHTANTSIHLTSGDVQNQISGKTDNTDFSAHTADTSIHLTSGDVQNAISGKADISYVDQSVSGKQSTLTAGRAISINNNTVAFNLPVYKGSGDTNVSICVENGNLQGLNKINSTFGAGIGWGLITQNTGESSIGSYNKSFTDGIQAYGTSGKTIFTIGNGSNDGKRHNAFEIRANGDMYIADTSASGQEYEKPMIKLQDTVSAIGNLKFVSLTQADYDALVTGGTTDANTIYFIKNS